jgi:hypothetical protein
MRAHALASLLVLLAAACGGSSSETPPPLEPDPESARYTGPRYPSKEEDASAEAPVEPETEEAPALPARPARATWGTGKSTPKVAPAPASPVALPPRPATSAPAD